MGHHLYEDLLEVGEVLPEYILDRLALVRVFDKLGTLPVAEIMD